MLKKLQKSSDILNKFCFIICGLVMALMVIVVLWGVFTRVINHASFWSEEISRYCYMITLFLATPITIKYANGAKMDFVQPLLKGKGLTAYKILMYDIVGLCAVIMIKSGIELMQISSHRTSSALKIPMCAIYVSFPLSGFIILFHCFNGIIQRIFGKGDEEIREEERV